MNNTEQRQWLEYWRRSLKDAENADIEIQNFRHKNKGLWYNDFILIENFSPSTKCIPDETKSKCKEILCRLETSETDVFISPFLLKKLRKKYSAFSPFWYIAHIDSNGQLSIPEETRPIVPRKYLSPTVDTVLDENLILGDLDVAEDAISNNHDGQFENYDEYIKYVCNVFTTITGKSFLEYSKSCIQERDQDNQDSFEAYGRKITCNTAIIVFPSDDRKSTSAGVHILKLYDYLLVQSSYPALLAQMINGKANTTPFLAEGKWISFNGKHLGQMKDDYPLSYSQRRSLYTILSQWNEPVHVVNGPPGTGKTTLLQSIVANMVVKSAITGEPSIIWGSAATNQAVTNIIDSFSQEGQGVRWLPSDFSFHGGYGTYFPSSSVSTGDLDGKNYIRFNGQTKTEEGTFAEIESQEYLSKAEDDYIKSAQEYFESPEISDVNRVIKKLQEAIHSYQEDLSEITNSAETLINFSLKLPQYWDDGDIRLDIIINDIYTNRSKLESIDREIKSISSSMRKYRDELKTYTNSATEVENIIKSYDRTIIDIKSQIDDLIYKDTHIFCLKKFFFGKKIHKEIAGHIERCNRKIEHCLYEMKEANESLASLKIEMRNIENKLNDLQYQIDSKQTERSSIYNQIEVLKQLRAEACKWGDLIGRLLAKGLKLEGISIPKPGKYDFFDQLDKLRARLFALSIRYWEGRWLLETKDAVEKNEGYKDDKDSVKCRLRRRAMLTPCFVSTFHSAPKKLSYWDSEAYQSKYFLNYIDCLIIDEAGQASPEISIPLFALAKKAVVVGDVKQIEPVWSILKSVDNSNLAKFNLKTDDSNEFKGRMCSCGSIMKIAQAACAVKDDSIEEKGNILLEHRRCLPGIIKYCSDLAYNGQIIPKRDDEDTIFPKMAFYNVRSSIKTKQGNKRMNQDESLAICEWLQKNRQKIEDKYGKIEKCVGILTPFRGQKELLYNTLKEYGFNAEGFKMGTVHALQGAERSIILFSSVYTAEDNVGKMFFDENVNMLNVAVSRAKDSFILFGDERIFKDKNTPSGKLYEIVKKNRITISQKTGLDIGG